MTAPPYALLETARADVGMSITELWIAYFALGGVARPEVLRAYLRGWHTGPFDYDVAAHAVNERYLERGLNHPVPYRDDLI